MNLAFPFQIDGQGRVAASGYSDHLRQLIEQLLFTSPGERVNRPDFGVGLLSAVFGTTSAEETIALQFLVQEALGKWLGKLIEVKSVVIRKVDAKLFVRIDYLERKSRSSQSVTFEVVGQ